MLESFEKRNYVICIIGECWRTVRPTTECIRTKRDSFRFSNIFRASRKDFFSDNPSDRNDRSTFCSAFVERNGSLNVPIFTSIKVSVGILCTVAVKSVRGGVSFARQSVEECCTVYRNVLSNRLTCLDRQWSKKHFPNGEGTAT